MTKQHPIRNDKPVNANLVAFILIINFIVIGGLIFTTMPLPSPQARGEEPPVVALIASSTATPPLPTVTPQHELTLTVTPFPPTADVTSISTQSPRVQGVPEGDPANGQDLFNTFQPAASFACSTCHRADSEDRLIGPGLLNIGLRAETRVEGQNAIEYIYTSIVEPGAYVVDTFPDGLMPLNWAEIYSEREIYDIIAYLITLR